MDHISQNPALSPVITWHVILVTLSTHSCLLLKQICSFVYGIESANCEKNAQFRISHMVFFCAMVCFCVANLHLVLLYKGNGSQLLPIATGIVMHGCSTSLVAIVIQSIFHRQQQNDLDNCVESIERLRPSHTIPKAIPLSVTQIRNCCCPAKKRMYVFLTVGVAKCFASKNSMNKQNSDPFKIIRILHLQ